MATTVEFEFRNKRWSSAEKGLKAFGDALSADWDGAAKTLSNELRMFLDSVAQALAARHGNPWPDGTGAKTLSKRSGRLIQAIVDSVIVGGSTIDTIEGTIGADLPYAGIQEMGGIIRAKRVKYLTIPLKAALDNRGIPLKKSARDWENTFVARSKAGNLIIFQRNGAAITPLYVLKTSVKIPPRLGLRETLSTGLPYFVEKAMDAMVKAVVDAKGATA